jgi:hypothetical protein
MLQDFCDLAGTRTQDPYIKSVLLYQLSYQIEQPIFYGSFICTYCLKLLINRLVVNLPTYL